MCIQVGKMVCAMSQERQGNKVKFSGKNEKDIEINQKTLTAPGCPKDIPDILGNFTRIF